MAFLKIVYVITRADVIGGASVHLFDLAVGAQQKGYDVEVFVGGHGVFLDKLKDAGLKCRSLKYMQREISPWNDLMGFFELRKLFIKSKPDLVHLHSSKAGILGRLAAKIVSIPVVFTAHGWAFTEGVSSKKRFIYIVIERFMARFSNSIITVSEFDRQLALDSNVGNPILVRTVHNGMPNLPLIQRKPNASIVKMIMVARFEEQKDQQSLIKALAQIEQKKWRLEFVGNGSLMAQAVTLVESLGLSDHIFFSGACDDVAKRLEQADVFLLISNWEGLPLTILEAMRASLPVIASKVGGVPEAVDDGQTGYLVPRGDVMAISDAIQKILSNEVLRLSLGLAGRKKFEQQFLFDSMLDKTLNMYELVLKNKA